MSRYLDLARPDILALTPYTHAAWNPQLERLHANELPWRVRGDDSRAGLNRYPEPQPQAARAAARAALRRCAGQLLVGRGSDEAIDLLTRAFCRAGGDNVIVCPPTFGMYAVAARIQGAGVVAVPLRPTPDFALDVAGDVCGSGRNIKLVPCYAEQSRPACVCDEAAIEQIIEAARGRALAGHR